MENTQQQFTVESQGSTGNDQRQHGERRKENKAIGFVDRRAFWRRAADRMERDGRPVTALFFRNEAAIEEAEAR